MSQEPPHHRRIEDGAPDPAFYEAIGGDAMVRRVLDAFYDQAFVDPVIGHFFEKADKATLKAKQFGFLRMRFTGERGQYMGQRPRNAHHWMIVSDADFDHRQRLMERTLREAGLAPEHIRKWLDIEEVFRVQIVKDRPWPLFYRGFASYFIDGRREDVAGLDTLCDACQGEIPKGGAMVLEGERVLCAACGGAEAVPGEG